MRIAIGQVNAWVGDVEGNASLVLEACQKAARAGAQMAVFPELIVTGYPPRDLLNVNAFVSACEAAVARIVEEIPEGLVVVFGAPRKRRKSHVAGRALHNCAIACRRGEILLEVAKALLPTYDVFDERRYFEPAGARVPRVFEAHGQRVGLVVCEDMWNDRLLWGDRRFYDRDPVAETVEQGASLIINISASPFAQDKHRIRRNLVTHAARRWRVPVVYVNAVGGNDGLLFDGGSLVSDAGGAAIAELPFFESDVRIIDTAAPADASFALHDPNPWELLHRALVLGVRDYARKTGMNKWVIGLSGGVDSALVASIASLALGPSSGLALAMPSRYSSDHSLADARALADTLRIPFRVVPIEPAHQAYEVMLAEPEAKSQVASSGTASYGDVTFENIQARIRGATLMAFANRESALLLTTGNKSECSVGYCTLYGDTCGGLAVIADLWKHEVYGLCRWLNAHKLDGAIPESTLTKPPSAELRPGQRDDQSLPPYDTLDAILAALVDRELGADEAAQVTGHPLALVRDIAQKLYRAEYKRQQFAPALKVSARAWVGRDYPIAMGYKP